MPPRIPLPASQNLETNLRLARCVRQPAEHRENQGLSLQIVGFSVARGADDLFPYLAKARKARQVLVGIGLVGMQAFRDPAIDAVDEGRKRDAVAGTERIAERVQFARIDLRQARK